LASFRVLLSPATSWLFEKKDEIKPKSTASTGISAPPIAEPTSPATPDPTATQVPLATLPAPENCLYQPAAGINEIDALCEIGT